MIHSLSAKIFNYTNSSPNCTSLINKRKEKPLFANARSIKNALDRARMRQANRIFESRGQVLTKKELVNIEAQDILQSSIFNS